MALEGKKKSSLVLSILDKGYFVQIQVGCRKIKLVLMKLVFTNFSYFSVKFEKGNISNCGMWRHKENEEINYGSLWSESLFFPKGHMLTSSCQRDVSSEAVYSRGDRVSMAQPSGMGSALLQKTGLCAQSSLIPPTV